MARLNKTTANPTRTRGGIVTTASTPDTVTHEGGKGFIRDEKSELFLMAATTFYGENTFYEKAADRNTRLVRLTHIVAKADPEWLIAFVGWLRGPGNIRTASIVIAAEGAAAMQDAKITRPADAGREQPGYIRQLIHVAIQRPDEIGEFLSYWRSTIKRAVSGGVQRGLAERIGAMYTEFNMLKWDTPSHGYRFGDVLALVHPAPANEVESVLWRYAYDRRKGRGDDVPSELAMVRANRELREKLTANPESVEITADVLRAAGFTWEDLLSLVGSKIDKKTLWTELIPTMGYMALLRNLRNFEQVGIPSGAFKKVCATLSNPHKVAVSRQLPFRFLSAYKEVQRADVTTALATALDLSVQNIPELPGKTIVLVDTSGSMTAPISDKSKILRHEAGGLFGVALAAKNNGAVLYGFANGYNVYRHEVRQGANVLRETERFNARSGEDGHGTNIAGSSEKAWAANKDAARMVIVSDMQCMRGIIGWGDERVSDRIPADFPVYAFDMSGYRATSMTANPKRVQFGSLSDSTFALLKAIENGTNATWPWEL